VVGVYWFWRDMGYALGALIARATADALGYGGAIGLVAALTAVSGLWVLGDMPCGSDRHVVHGVRTESNRSGSRVVRPSLRQERNDGRSTRSNEVMRFPRLRRRFTERKRLRKLGSRLARRLGR
jgi:hypothetical protein